MECRLLRGESKEDTLPYFIWMSTLWNLYHNSKHAPVLCLRNKDASRTLGLRIVILLWHFGRSLVDPESYRGWQAMQSLEEEAALPDGTQTSVVICKDRSSQPHSMPILLRPFTIYTCFSSCLVSSDLFSPLKIGLAVHSHSVLLVLRCL